MAAIPDEGYELGIGRQAIDLRELDWEDDTVVELRADLGVGETVVAVPENVCVTGDLDAGAGAIEVGGDEEGGFDVDTQPLAGTTATPRLELDADVDLGHILVVNDDELDIDDDRDHGPFRDRDDGDRDQMREAMAQACADEPEPPASSEREQGTGSPQDRPKENG